MLFFSMLITICTSFQVQRTGTPPLSVKAVIDSRSGKSLSVKVTLVNNTADTVKYMSMNCSWQDFYSIDNDRWVIFGDLCCKNGPEIRSIPPYQTETSMLKLERVFGSVASKSSMFRIGFRFVPPPLPLQQIPVKLEKSKPNATIIWSNEVWARFPW